MTIVVFRQHDGTYSYAPKSAVDDPRLATFFHYSDEPGFPSVAAALNAIRRDKTIPSDHEILVASKPIGGTRR
jgi:hypothetical protein